MVGEVPLVGRVIGGCLIGGVAVVVGFGFAVTVGCDVRVAVGVGVCVGVGVGVGVGVDVRVGGAGGGVVGVNVEGLDVGVGLDVGELVAVGVVLDGCGLSVGAGGASLLEPALANRIPPVIINRRANTMAPPIQYLRLFVLAASVASGCSCSGVTIGAANGAVAAV